MGPLVLVLFSLVGLWLGWSISMDLSNHPLFQNANTAFVGFWTVIGLILGYVVGRKIEDFLYNHFYTNM